MTYDTSLPLRKERKGIAPLLTLSFAFVCVVAPCAVALAEFSFSDPVALNSSAYTDSGNDNWSRVTTDSAGNWIATWYSYDDLGGTIGTDADILYTYSTDNGVTWSATAPLNSTAFSDGIAMDQCASVCTDGSGTWIAAWALQLGDPTGTDGDIFYAHSTNNGASWSSPTALNTNAVTDSGVDLYVELATDGSGNWVAVWMSNEDLGGIGTDWDVLVARSADNGATWTPPAPLNSDAGTDSNNDHQPHIVTDGAGNWLVEWVEWSTNNDYGGTNDYDVITARSKDNGATWPSQAFLASNSGGGSHIATDGHGMWMVAWISDDDIGGTIGTDEDILFSRSANNGVTWSTPAPVNADAATDARDESFIKLATDGSGNWLALWDVYNDLGGESDADVFMSRSTDSGVTWTNPASLNRYTSKASHRDRWSYPATDGAGNWINIWQSTNTLGGTTGEDVDILFARLPAINNPGRQYTTTGDTLTFTVSTSVLGGPTPSLTASNLPDDSTFIDNGDGKGTFTWITDAADAGDYHGVHFEMTNGSTIDSKDISIRVIPPTYPVTGLSRWRVALLAGFLLLASARHMSMAVRNRSHK
ncbi:hypothetical protein ACFL1X_00140 [Candidatus Hydrogenedentota bacterium]